MIDPGVRQDNTWLVVDPIVGCTNNCQYCFLRIYEKATVGGKIIFSPNEAVEKLVNYWAFSESSFPMIGSETDMFLSKDSISYLMEFIRCYADKGIKNPLCISTKCYIPDEFIKFIETFKETNFIFYLSYSGLPKEIEPQVSESVLLSNFRRLSDSGHKPIHLFRPIIPQNSTVEVFTRVLTNVEKYASCSVLRGLNLNPLLQEKIWFWSEAKSKKINFNENVSIWPSGWYENLIEAKKQVPNYAIFFKNSCAIAYKSNMPEFVGTYGTDKCKEEWCPEHQINKCKCFVSSQVNDINDVKRTLRELGLDNEAYFDEYSNKLHISGDLSHEQVAFISQKINRRIIVDNIISSHEWGGYVLGHKDLII